MLAPMPIASVARLRGVPWHGLDRLGPVLDPVVAAVLAGAPAERELARLLRREQATITGPRRLAVAEAVLGAGLWRRRLAVAPGLAPRAVVVRLARDLGGAADAPRWLEHDAAPAPEPASFADAFSLPDWLASEVSRTPSPARLADALNQPGPIALRASTLRASPAALAARLADEGVSTRPGAWARDAVVVVERRRGLYGLGAWHDAWFEVQDEGSQLLAEIVDARPGHRVLDLCAGAGGKALALAAHMADTGELWATDIDTERLARLRTRAARAGATCVRTCRRDAIPEGRFDRILVDAPCSELGALRRGPDLRWRLDPAAFAPLPALQRALVVEAASRLAPGGHLVYATCTFRREENEEVAAAAEAACGELERVPAGPLADADGALRTWPHVHGTDGFFAVAWRRR